MIKEIIKVLNNNSLVALPTDTIYGVIGDPTSIIAVNKLYELKNRDRNKKLSIFLDDKNKIKDICYTTEFINDVIENKTINITELK